MRGCLVILYLYHFFLKLLLLCFPLIFSVALLKKIAVATRLVINQVLQMGIYKGGPKHLFLSYRFSWFELHLIAPSSHALLAFDHSIALFQLTLNKREKRSDFAIIIPIFLYMYVSY